MLKNMKYLMLLPLTAIVSCGYSTSYLVEGNKYVSAVFKENYYTHWDNELKNASKVASIDVSDEMVICEVDYGYDDFKLHGIEEIDPNFFEEAPNLEDYGTQFKMNDVDDLFNYGYQSKLFDGQMVCGAQNGHSEFAYQLGRVQIQESGFSIRFSKESNELHYFAMQFKASTDNTLPSMYKVDGTPAQSDYDLMHESKIKLNINLYIKTFNGIEAHPFTANVDLTGTVSQGSANRYKTNNGHVYTFLAFDLEKYNTDNFTFSRLVGISIDFEIMEDELLAVNKNKGVDMTYIHPFQSRIYHRLKLMCL